MGNIHFHVGIATSTDWVRCTLASTPLLNFFFFPSRRRHTSWPRDWSSDVCSSDLLADEPVAQEARQLADQPAVLPLGAQAEDGIVALTELIQEHWNVGRIVLQIAVEGNEDFARRSEERRVGKECSSVVSRYSDEER